MNKDLLKGAAIVIGIVMVLAAGAILLSEDGWGKLTCVGRAVASGVSISNIHSVCGL
jgi:hypothetical protein